MIAPITNLGQFDPLHDVDLLRPVNVFHPLNRGLRTWHFILPSLLGSRLLDTMAFRNHATFTGGPTITVDKFGYSVDYDATDQSQIPLSVDAKSQITLMMWVTPRSTSTGASNDYFLSFPEAVSSNGVDIGQRDATWRFDLVTHDAVSLNTVGTVDTDRHFLALTYDGATLRGYVDGVEIVSDAITGTIKNADGNGYIAGLSTDTAFGGVGKSGDVRVYFRALAASEIAWYYRITRGGHYRDLLNRIGGPQVLAAGGGTTVNVGQTLPSLSQSVSGAVTVSGGASQTLPSVKQSASGAASVSGSAAQTLPGLSQAASGAVLVSGSVGQTLPALTQSAAGSAVFSGDAAQTLPSLVQSASGAVLVSGDSAQTLPSLSQAASGAVLVSGTVAQTLPGLTQSASGTVVAAGEASGPVSQTLPAISQQASGSVLVAGSVAQSLPALSQSVSASLLVQGTASQVLPSMSQSASGIAGAIASAAQTLPAMSQSISGDVTVAGTVVQTLPSLSQSIAGALPVAGTISQTLPAISQSVGGSVVVSGTVAQTLPSIVQAATGTVSTVVAISAQFTLHGAPTVHTLHGAPTLHTLSKRR